MDNKSVNKETIVFLEYISNTENIRVIYNYENNGPWVARYYNPHIYNILPDKYILTDPDLQFNKDLPSNFLDILVNISEKYQAVKVGFAIDESDYEQFTFLREEYIKNKDTPSPFFTNVIPDDNYILYNCITDTTFVLINKKYVDTTSEHHEIRIGGNFTCKHLPWYDHEEYGIVTDQDIIDMYSLNKNAFSSWGSRFLEYVQNKLKYQRKKLVFILGITGQDGSYLTELLIHKGYTVHGLIYNCMSSNTDNIRHMLKHPRLHLHYSNNLDYSKIQNILSEITNSDFISLDIYNFTQNMDNSVDRLAYIGKSVLTMLEWVNLSNYKYKIRYYHSSCSEIYYRIHSPSNYSLLPDNIADLYAYWIVTNYRNTCGIFAVNGIIFNHESPRNTLNDIPRKTLNDIAKLLLGEKDIIEVSNLDSKYEFGHAKDFVEGIFKMIEHSCAREWILTTGKSYTLRECITYAFKTRDIHIVWVGSGKDEIGVNNAIGETYIKIIEELYIPDEVNSALPDDKEVHDILGWTPQYTFEKTIEGILNFDLRIGF